MTEKALVAFPDGAVLWATPLVRGDLDDVGGNAVDVGMVSPGVDACGLGDDDAGLLVWEGEVVFEALDGAWGPETDVVYNGVWRRPTKDEWSAIMEQRDPWSTEHDGSCE